VLRTRSLVSIGHDPHEDAQYAGAVSFVTMDDGVRLWTETTGIIGRPAPVVVLHGGPGLWDYLRPAARLLDDSTVVHRFDQRGCGRSDPSDDQRMDRLVADLDNLRPILTGPRRWATSAVPDSVTGERPTEPSSLAA
jgi:pimeloyl-ACP methyl ester carboxylesterase